MSNLVKNAEEEFHTSSQYPVPSSWSGPTFKIRNDYPAPAPAQFNPGLPALPLPAIPDAEAPWLKVNFHRHPLEYAMMVKEYCWEGNRSVDFVVQNNTVSRHF